MLPTKLLSSLLILCVLFVFKSNGQDTFSIVAVDTETGEVGSAGATCLDTVVEGVSAIIISDIIPGVGAIHTQSFWDPANQANARAYLEMGLSAQAVMDSVVANDVAGTPLIRQYGIAIINSAGDAERAAYTGANCFDWKGQFLGGDFAVQGNILLNEDIIDSMATRFFFEEGDLADKLMAAMQGANVPGADSRCLSPQNTSSRSAFIRVARP
ncbi:MAG: putative Ntn-hydrolase superfamily protein, partial [Limisphaerales bacterium]